MVGARETTDTPSMKQLENKLYETSIQHTFKEIKIIAIQYAGSILLHKKQPTNTNRINMIHIHTHTHTHIFQNLKHQGSGEDHYLT
jgi:hypothetical protein